MVKYCPHCGDSKVQVFNDEIRDKEYDYPDVEFQDLQLMCINCHRTTSAVVTRKI